MEKKEIMAKLQEVFVEVFDDESLVVEENTTAGDVDEWDSLMHLQLIANVEETFGMHFTLGEINNFANVGEMADCIKKHLEA